MTDHATCCCTEDTYPPENGAETARTPPATPDHSDGRVL